MKKIILSFVIFVGTFGTKLMAQDIQYVNEFKNENHPEIGYWFISPNLYQDERYIANMDSIAKNCKYTMVFLTAREGANFYDYLVMHKVFKNIVTEAHKYGIKVGLQLWGNSFQFKMEDAHRMIVENELILDKNGNGSMDAGVKYIRFPDRNLKTDLFKVYAFKKTGEGFYDANTLKDITSLCETNYPNKDMVQVKIKGNPSLQGLTALVMTQQYCSQTSAFGDGEINGFTEAMKAYADIAFDGFGLDEYGNKFVSRPLELKTDSYKGRWFSNSMEETLLKTTGQSLTQLLFDGRYAPQGKPEVRMKAINEYMDFMRKGGVRVENAVYKKSKEIFGNDIFNGIHNTYHNSLVNDEMWANGIGWWTVARAYGQTDEKTLTPTQMGIAMAHKKNAMYNQYYDKDLDPVITKALFDLRYGIRTHYHALNDKRPLRFDLEFPEAVEKINKVENCARLLNKFNPQLPDIKLLVIFGMEALSNWYPYLEDRGLYDLNDKVKAEERAMEIWKAGYLNALVPSELITNHTLFLNKKGKPEMNGHVYDAVVYLNPQFAKEEEIKFLENFVAKGGKLMIEGRAEYNFKGENSTVRFNQILKKAAAVGYSIEGLASLQVSKNLLSDGCKTEDGAYVFTNYNSLFKDSVAHFTIQLKGNNYTGTYKGLAVISFDEKESVNKIAATGFSQLQKNGKTILNFKNPTDMYLEYSKGKKTFILSDKNKKVQPTVNLLN